MHSLTAERPRYLRRQWKQQKPYLPRWDSVPSLRLGEMGRKLAQCTSCGFALPIQSLPICVWCQLKLPDSLVAVDVSDPSNRAFKMRRASEPLFKKRLREERAGRTRRIRVSVSVTQLNDALPEVSITAEEEVERPKLREREDTSETIVPAECKKTGQISPASSPHLLEPSSPTLDPKHHSDLGPSTTQIPTNSLRHKKRFAPVSLSSAHTKASSLSVPITEYRFHSRSRSQQSLEPIKPLGQPSRPYYTAIRNNMSNSVHSASAPSAWADTPVPDIDEFGLHRSSIGSSVVPPARTKPGARARKSFSSPRTSSEQEIDLRVSLARDLGGAEADREDFRKTRAQSRKHRISRLTRGIIDLIRK